MLAFYVPGIKALLSTGVAEALLVAAGLAGVGARALRLLLDSDGRAVKRHCCKRQSTENSDEGWHTHTHTQTAGCIIVSHSALPRYYGC